MKRIIPSRKPRLSQNEIARLRHDRLERARQHNEAVQKRTKDQDFESVFEQIESENDGTDS